MSNSQSTATAPISNPFAALAAINVNDHVEKKGGFSYLSWPFAVAQLRQYDPTATWEVRRFHGLPFLVTEAGVFVEVAVTVQGVTLSQIHPVLDGRNRPLMAPSAFDINTSIQRCLVKAIALHGLGLYIYAGEDLPQVSANALGVGSGEREAANDASERDEPASMPRRPDLSADRRPVQRPPQRPDEAGFINKSQQAYIHRMALEVGISLDKLLAYFNFSSLQAIPVGEFTRVLRSLEQQRAA